jgi:hypothetical protein
VSTDFQDVTLSLTGEQHERLRAFLFPGDGKEAAAIALCGRGAGKYRHRILVHELHEIPYEACSERSPYRVTWSTDVIAPLLDKAEKKGLSVVKFHSHPGHYPKFSETDDAGDNVLLPAIKNYVEADVPHGSVVMLPDGSMFGRVLWKTNNFIPLRRISVAGPDIFFWDEKAVTSNISDFRASHKQAFGEGTTNLLSQLSIAVVGCSGTGSPLIEQLVRLGVGELILVDDDYVEERNVNRIVNSTMEDARKKRPKVDVLAEAIERIGLGTRVRRYNRNLSDPEVIRAVAEADVLFGCMDTITGRFLLNLIASYYIIPYFDLGVRLEAVPEGLEQGKIREICGSVHYLQPGRSSLLSRGLVSLDKVQAEGLRKNDPASYSLQEKEGYIRGVQENRPAVISVNMFIASLAVNDFLARLHPYREQSNSDIASIEFSLRSLEIFPDPEEKPCAALSGFVGTGDIKPLLNLPMLSDK